MNSTIEEDEGYEVTDASFDVEKYILKFRGDLSQLNATELNYNNIKNIKRCTWLWCDTRLNKYFYIGDYNTKEWNDIPECNDTTKCGMLNIVIKYKPADMNNPGTYIYKVPIVTTSSSIKDLKKKDVLSNIITKGDIEKSGTSDFITLSK
jgi:hypothetical protein